MANEAIAVTEKPRNIYEKMASVKTKLYGLKKTGENKFSHYTYFELGDILPVLTPALQEERLYMKTQFSATEQIAKLIVIDIDNTQSTIEFETKFPECEVPGAHAIQNLGAAQTYTRRYLIMTAFDIAEADIVDAGAEKEEQKPERKNNSPKGQQPAKQTPQTKASLPQTPLQDETAVLKREAWELIKKLPQEQQQVWLDSCKGANEATLREIIGDLKKILSDMQHDTERKRRLVELEDEVFDLIEKLPTETQGGWIEAARNAGGDAEALAKLGTEIREKMAVLEAAAKPKPPNGKPSAQAKPDAKDLEIF
jgi:hypothetical protein